MLNPMNHREMEYNIRKFRNENHIDETQVNNLFSEWDNETEKNAAVNLMTWLEQTGQEVFQEDLLLDYGADCLRFYLMFEKTPEPEDTWLDTWEECNLEGCYKFLGRFRRMILVANHENQAGYYQNLDSGKMKNEIYRMQREVMHHLSKGNTMPDRHNAISVIMEGMKPIHKELGIGELVTRMHSHEIAMAIPHSGKNTTKEMEEVHVHAKKNAELETVLEEMIILLAPFAPILAEHLWQQTREDNSSVLTCKWENKVPVVEKIMLPVQVNAKTKKVISVNADTSGEEIEAIAKQEISQILQGKEYSVIYVPGKIINFIVQK